MSHCSVYITAPDRAVALAIARTLVEERLAACANLLGSITSIYRWEGKIHEEDEVALIAKTSEVRVPALIARVKSIHPYSVPCIVVWPIAAGHPAYLDWISAETTAL
jgi:periplasmic divalent cation tolerance protein